MFTSRFAFRPPPLPDELLSSWIQRTATGMLFLPYAFVHTYWQSEPPVLSRDIDLLGDPRVIAGMAVGTGTNPAVAASTTLTAFDGRLFADCGARGIYPWVLPVGVRNRDRKLPGQQYCPHCLSSDERPYLRKQWRLAVMSVCVVHSQVLLDRCSRCASPLMPFRSRALHVCWNCNRDLRHAKGQPPNQDAIRFNALADDALHAGWGRLGASTFHYSPILFSVLRQLGRNIISGPRSQRLRTVLGRQTDISDRPFNFEGGREEVEFLSSAERHRMHALIMALADNWPYNYVSSMSEAGMWHSWALRDMRSVPFALRTIVDQGLRPRTYSPPVEEVRAAARYLAKRRIGVSGRDLRRLIGDSIHTQEALATIAAPTLAAELEPPEFVSLPQD
ncbi:TniQ family protein [Phreatobacter oligotrophus]|uniref:TniQ protein n=1 Tax=Phreatobacter oligotrophus TaxID=1122261 RepID=A0A2T4YX65_9HYPH|nr:TniQ family protein [Phreatobacter oligotrophus]PTM50321.1 TniQ protein [Phreatobacter oligotrophus]